MMRETFIALGANVGERLETMRRATAEIAALAEGALRVSRVYETAPMYVDEQPPFLNAVVAMPSAMDAEQLLRTLLRIESRLGRVREERFGPRPIDLDLLAAGDEMARSELLTLPHPLMQERPFVLFPLCDVAPTWCHPRLGTTALAMRDALPLPKNAHPRPLEAGLLPAGGIGAWC